MFFMIDITNSLTNLDISWNSISKIPKEIEELVKLNEFNASHNELSTYPGYFHKLRTIQSFYNSLL